MDKTCKECSITKHTTEFPKNKALKSGYSNKCKSCRAAYTKEYRKKNRDKIAADLKLWRDRNKEHRSNYAEAWYAENKEKVLKQKKQYYCANTRSIAERNYKWKQANKDSVRASADRFRAKQLRATPLWVSSNPDELRLITQFYRRARELTRLTGVAHEVDHIIPLNGANVCGFHCAENLQILTAKENRQKGNRVNNE